MPALRKDPTTGKTIAVTPVFEPNYGLVTADHSSLELTKLQFVRAHDPLVRILDAKTPQDYGKQWWLKDRQ